MFDKSNQSLFRSADMQINVVCATFCKFKVQNKTENAYFSLKADANTDKIDMIQISADNP